MGEHLDYQQVINETRELLSANSEWCKRYVDYAAKSSQYIPCSRTLSWIIQKKSSLKMMGLFLRFDVVKAGDILTRNIDSIRRLH